jgi:hypothetical protein
MAVAGCAHALHDGYTDLIYVLLPVWQAEFALGYGALATAAEAIGCWVLEPAPDSTSPAHRLKSPLDDPATA